MSRVNKDDQPDLETKIRTLKLENTGWDYLFGPPPVYCGGWSHFEWVNFIGDNWFRKETK